MFGNGSPSGSRTVNLRMPGQYYDSESSLFYNWNRYYNPADGRYISSDPIGIEGGLNIFLYANTSPVMYGDPTGLQAVLTCTVGPNPICIVGLAQTAVSAGAVGYGLYAASHPPAIPNAVTQADDPQKVQADARSSANTGVQQCTASDPGGKDPCKGLRDQILAHQKKLQDYIADPLSQDNKGFLSQAISANNQTRANNIYNARVSNLKNQIENFKRLLEQCERQNGSR